MVSFVRDDVKYICADELAKRISRMRKHLDSAKMCLSDSDFVQCAVRMQHAAKEAKFDELLMNIFDSVSEFEKK